MGCRRWCKSLTLSLSLSHHSLFTSIPPACCVLVPLGDDADDEPDIFSSFAHSAHSLEHVSRVLHRDEPSSWQRDGSLQGLASSVSPHSLTRLARTTKKVRGVGVRVSRCHDTFLFVQGRCKSTSVADDVRYDAEHLG